MPTQRRHHHLPSHALIPTTPFHPTANPAAFRDLLIFEERLKQAAARYTRRKRKYQTLLTFLLAATLTSAYHAAASSPHWSGILDLALRWAADPDTDYRTGLNGAEDVSAQRIAHSHHRVRKGISRVRGRDTAAGAAANNNAAERRQRRSTGGAGAGAGAVASAAGKAKGAVWDVVDAGADSAAAVVSAAVSAALASGSGSSTLSSKTNNNNNKGKARAAFAFRTDSPLISTPPSAADKASLLAASKTAQPSSSAEEERTYYTHADGAAMLRYYLWVGLFLFFSTTTFLFFASGLYSERIAAGATFVPQANRALGYYNLYLNTRTGRGAATTTQS
ncbi:unnamed protein product [Tilletia controversa]|nr:unnamed protein product [Tilletia caries]CAD6901668.1 unnamed protein product [Tilletia controversa]CAD6981049.1 unnamed protein product [Tilletia controversa]CAD7067144.1 unnamed protein product [Tilletia caries]